MKKIIITIGLVIFGAMLCSCDKQLTTGDATKVDSGNFTSSAAGLNQVLTSTYRAFLMGNSQEQPGASYQGVSGFLMLYDLMGADIAVNKNYGSSPEPIYQFASQRNQASGDAHYIWETMYKAINEANIIIKNVDDATGSSADKAALKGQALAIRAYCYFSLLINYQQTYAIAKNKRGVILRLSPDDPADLGFSTVEECYQQVVTDLKDAETALAGFRRTEKWQLDANVVAGMLARVYQVMGNWDGAYAEANKAYSAYNTLMSKEEWTSGMDHLMADGCAELIWGVKYTNVSNVGSNTVFNNWWNFDPSYGEGMQSGPLYHFLCIFVTDTYVNLFEGDDTDYRGTKCTKTDNVTDEDEIDVMFWHRTNASSFPGTTEKWAYNKLKSYGDGSYATHTNSNHSYDIDAPLMRGSEMLLIMAEAKANLGQSGDAVSLLNTLQRARNVKNPTTTTAKADLLEAIYVERRKELLGEGVTGSYDLLRLQKDLVRVDSEHYSWGLTELDPMGAGKHGIPSNDYRFITQIPQMEIANNEAVTTADQNPYKGQ